MAVGSIGLGYGQSWGGENGNYDTTAQTNTNESSTQRNNQTQNTQSQTSGQTTTSTLDQNTQDVLKRLIENLGASGQTDVAALAKSLYDRGTGAEAALNQNVSAVVNEAARTGSREIGRLNTELATAAGSRMNSYVAGATAEAGADLTTKLAAMEAQMRTGNRLQATNEMQQALQLLAGSQGEQTTQIAQLASILKGANTTTSSTQNTQEQQSLAALLQILSQQQQSGTSHTDQHTSSHSSGWGIAGQLGF